MPECIASCVYSGCLIQEGAGWVSFISDSPISVTAPLKYWAAPEKQKRWFWFGLAQLDDLCIVIWIYVFMYLSSDREIQYSDVVVQDRDLNSIFYIFVFLFSIFGLVERYLEQDFCCPGPRSELKRRMILYFWKPEICNNLRHLEVSQASLWELRPN